MAAVVQRRGERGEMGRGRNGTPPISPRFIYQTQGLLLFCAKLFLSFHPHVKSKLNVKFLNCDQHFLFLACKTSFFVQTTSHLNTPYFTLHAGPNDYKWCKLFISDVRWFKCCLLRRNLTKCHYCQNVMVGRNGTLVGYMGRNGT